MLAGSRGEGAEVAAFVRPINAQSLLLSHGRFDILFTRSLATTLLVIALTVMVLPAIVPPVKRLLGTVGEETGT